MKSQKITTRTYFDVIKNIGFENLPLVLKQSHTVIMTKTDNGEDWSIYKNDADLKRMIDLVFKKLEEFVASNKKNLSGTEEKEEEQMEGTKSNVNKPKRENPYSKIGTEIKFIHRFLAFHDKILYKNTFEIFIDELQKAIQRKEITKKSPVAKDIIAMQNAVINAFNAMKNAKHFVLKPETIKRYKTIIEKYENAYEDLDDEPREKTPKRKSIGLNGINQSNGKIMSSLDFANLEFSTIGLKDKWLEFIGDPAPGFTAMVYGRPKMGKSYLCVDFAGYLAKNHGKVLYVAKEEKLDATLQKKLKDKDVANENLFVADNLPKSLSGYQFVFLDSVNKLGLSPQELNKLKADNPGVCFIYVFQATKEGKFRGTNEFQHDVDIVIEVPKKGVAVQYGRFNQGGQMDIFENSSSENTAPQEKESQDLSGIKNSKKKVLTKTEAVIEIETELGLGLEELALELIPPKNDHAEIVSLLDHNAPTAETAVKKMVAGYLEEAAAEVSVTKVAFTQMDSDNLNTGAAYFSVGLKGTKEELEKIAGEDLLFVYDWQNQSVEGLAKKREDSLAVKTNRSSLDNSKNKTMKKTAKKGDWTEPSHLHPADWRALKAIKKHCDNGDFDEAMNYAMSCDTIVREEIPPNIWKKMGGQLTKTGEEKLKAMNKKSSPPTTEKIKQPLIVFNYGVRILKGVIEREWDLELTDSDYIKILYIALEKNPNLLEIINAIHENVTEFLIVMKTALEEWENNTEDSEKTSQKKFNPQFYENRKDDDNPSYMFGTTTTVLLVEALKGEFDINYLMRRELANRGLDKSGKWVGFNEAKKIHRI